MSPSPDVGLTSHEFWAAVIAFCLPWLIWILSEMMWEERRADSKHPWRWGDKQRRAAPAATWADHGLLAAVTFLTVFVVLKTALSQ